MFIFVDIKSNFLFQIIDLAPDFPNFSELHAASTVEVCEEMENVEDTGNNLSNVSELENDLTSSANHKCNNISASIPEHRTRERYNLRKRKDGSSQARFPS